MNSELIRHGIAAMAGGGIASLLRFSVGAWVIHAYPNERIPWATLAVNWLGCLAVGLIYGWTSDRWFMGLHARHLFVTGFLGGFTTFSAFSLETGLLFQRAWWLAALYVFSSLALGLLAFALCFWLGKR